MGFFCVRLFVLKVICEFMLWVTHPPADFTQRKQLTASCWDQSQGLNKAGFWEGGKERMDCPWHTETNIWTGRSVSNRKAIERQDRSMSLYSVETQQLHSRLASKGGVPGALCVCSFLSWYGLRAWGANLSSCSSAAFPSPRHKTAQEDFEGRLVKTKGMSHPGVTARKLLCVS